MNHDLKIELYPRQIHGMIISGLVTGVEVTHIPTGKSVAVNIFREQRKNRDMAIEILTGEIAKIDPSTDTTS